MPGSAPTVNAYPALIVLSVAVLLVLLSFVLFEMWPSGSQHLRIHNASDETLSKVWVDGTPYGTLQPGATTMYAVTKRRHICTDAQVALLAEGEEMTYRPFRDNFTCSAAEGTYVTYVLSIDRTSSNPSLRIRARNDDER